MSAYKQISIRLPPTWYERVARIQSSLSRPGMPARRAEVLRYIFAKGLEATEGVRGLSKTGRPAKRA